MKIKVYLNEWFINAGIVGFMNIMKENNSNSIREQDNYIEFETEELRDFHKYYFEYFFNIYNIAAKMENRMDNSFKQIRQLLMSVEEDKNKQKQEKIKSVKKYIKLVIKGQLDKIKKVDEDIYNEMFELYSRIDEVKEKEDISKLDDIFTGLNTNFYKEKINKRLTMNLFKSILSKSYFGQPSFLNVVKSALSYEEQCQLMYKDYISNIVEVGYLNNLVNDKYTLEEIKEYIQERLTDDRITKELQSVYSNINKKYIEKEKSIEDIKKYLKEKVFTSCSMCENENIIANNYSESRFVPLAISSENMENFFWNKKAKFPICDVCKLMLFCTPAGITSITKTVKENENGNAVYKEKQVYSFVNYDTNIRQLLQINRNFSNQAKLDKSSENPYQELILDIVKQEKQVSKWQLENIFVVEFEAEYLAYSRMEYFNIKRHVAEFFKNYSEKSLDKIKNYRFKLQIVDYILKNKELKYAINDRIRQELTKENSYGYECFLATRVRLELNLLRKGELEVKSIIEKNNNKLKVLYSLGMQIHEELKRKGEDNKLNGYTYKMLNSIKAGNKAEFMDIVIRLHMFMGKDVSPIFLEVMQDTNLDFESIGHSFMSGLISNKFEKEDANNNNQTVEE